MRKFLALFLFIILVFPLLFAAQVTAGVSSWVLDRDFYLDSLNQPQVFDTLSEPQFIAQVVNENLLIPDNFDSSELSSLISVVVTPEYLNSQVDNFINDLFDYLQGKTKLFEPVLELESLKQSLFGPYQDELLRAIVANLPACEPGQAPNVSGNFGDLCKPVGDSDELLIEYFVKPALPALVETMPDEILLEEVVPNWNQFYGWQSTFPGMTAPALLVLGVIILVFISLVIWYVTALISGDTWHLRLQWLGWMLIIPSLLVFILGFIVPSSVSAYWINFGLDRANFNSIAFGNQLNELTRVISDAMLPRIGNAFQMVGGICAAFALAFIFWGVATPRVKKE